MNENHATSKQNKLACKQMNLKTKNHLHAGNFMEEKLMKSYFVHPASILQTNKQMMIAAEIFFTV